MPSAPTLESIEPNTAFYRASGSAYPLGFLATEFLAKLSSRDAHTEYHRLTAQGTAWRAAFQQSFGVSIEAFYQQFEDYRSRGFK